MKMAMLDKKVMSGWKNDPFISKVIMIKKTSSGTKGGTSFMFKALAISGDEKGKGGFGYCEAREKAQAIKKAIRASKKRSNIYDFSSLLKRGNWMGVEEGHFKASRVLLTIYQEDRKFIRAGGIARKIFEIIGLRGIVCTTKLASSSNEPKNITKLIFDSLVKLQSIKKLTDARRESKKLQYKVTDLAWV